MRTPEELPWGENVLRLMPRSTCKSMCEPVLLYTVVRPTRPSNGIEV